MNEKCLVFFGASIFVILLQGRFFLHVIVICHGQMNWHGLLKMKKFQIVVYKSVNVDYFWVLWNQAQQHYQTMGCNCIVRRNAGADFLFAHTLLQPISEKPARGLKSELTFDLISILADILQPMSSAAIEIYSMRI